MTDESASARLMRYAASLDLCDGDRGQVEPIGITRDETYEVAEKLVAIRTWRNRVQVDADQMRTALLAGEGMIRQHPIVVI